MFKPRPSGFADKTETYAALASRLRALLHEERDFIANCANTAALLGHSLPELNRAGFYRLVDGQLVLDLDSSKLNCFDAADQTGLEKLAAVSLANSEER